MYLSILIFFYCYLCCLVAGDSILLSQCKSTLQGNVDIPEKPVELKQSGKANKENNVYDISDSFDQMAFDKASNNNDFINASEDSDNSDEDNDDIGITPTGN